MDKKDPKDAGKRMPLQKAQTGTARVIFLQSPQRVITDPARGALLRAMEEDWQTTEPGSNDRPLTLVEVKQ